VPSLDTRNKKLIEHLKKNVGTAKLGTFGGEVEVPIFGIPVSRATPFIIRLTKGFAPPKMLLAAVLTLPLLLSAVQAEDWPQWRGLNRDGVCDETDLLQSLPAEGLKVCWRVPVGWGFASPAKERLHCLDETTGQAVWTQGYDVAYED
jgi:hypothetical protein